MNKIVEFFRRLPKRGGVAKESRKLAINLSCAPGNLVVLSGVKEGLGDIRVSGAGNHVEFGSGTIFKGSVEVRGKNNKVVFGSNCAIRGRIVVKGNDQTVLVGEHTTFQSIYLLCDENRDVTIGRWCMFSRDIEVRTTDAHSVVDRETGLRINTPKSVTIGDHVWVGVGTLISKGAVVPDDCIVGAHSFVNGEFHASHVIIAGSPAKVVKEGVTWHRSRKKQFSEEELGVWQSDT